MAVSKDLMGLENAGAALKEEAFISICDLLIVFGHCGENKGEALLKPLQYKPDQPLGTVLNIFVQDHVFIDDEEEDIDDHQKIEELHKRRNFLASYCKLVVYNVLPTKVENCLILKSIFTLRKYFSHYFFSLVSSRCAEALCDLL